jgi:phage shock protein PspC (stress-responsive transcriptional regulator)|tara:strand:- start:1918 stop:2859 length:942 start_codon:yes stop_codon:yes gene_type:complete
MERSKNFHIFLGIAALLIAGSAGFYSVFGLSKLFSGATLSVIIMAGSLEFGKLVTAAFLYRYWDKINYLQKVYLSIATVVLILITSAGIFGYLSNAYQGATVTFEKESTALLYKEDRLKQLSEDKKFLKEELEAAVSELPDNYRTAKRKLREEYQPKINEVNTTMMSLKQEIGDLKIALVETGVDVGPAIYLARTFNTDVDTVVSFFIFVLIFVFDPLAVMLVIAFNQALLLKEKEDSGKTGAASKPFLKKNKKIKKWWEVYGEKKDNILKREKIEKKLDIVENRDSDSELKIEEKTSEKKIRNPLKGGIKIK